MNSVSEIFEKTYYNSLAAALKRGKDYNIHVYSSDIIPRTVLERLGEIFMKRNLIIILAAVAIVILFYRGIKLFSGSDGDSDGGGRPAVAVETAVG